MSDVRNAIADILDHTSLADVARRSENARLFLEAGGLAGPEQE